jgi:hypothetical protein
VKGKVTEASPDKVVAINTRCPFQDGEPEACLQFQAERQPGDVTAEHNLRHDSVKQIRVGLLNRILRDCNISRDEFLVPRSFVVVVETIQKGLECLQTVFRFEI